MMITNTHSPRPDIKAIARSFRVFASLSDVDIAGLTSDSHIERRKPGSSLFTEGATADRLYGVISGTVELVGGASEGRSSILLMVEGDLMMPAASLFDAPYLHGARAVGRTELLSLSSAAVRSAAHKSMAIALGLARVIGGQYRMAARHIVDLKERSAAQRLACLLLRLDGAHKGAGPARLPITKQGLAARLGITAETLSRLLQVLPDHGLILRGSSILVRDRKAITSFVGPQLYPGSNESKLGVMAI